MLACNKEVNLITPPRLPRGLCTAQSLTKGNGVLAIHGSPSGRNKVAELHRDKRSPIGARIVVH